MNDAQSARAWRLIPWRLIIDPPAPGRWNMAVDEALLSSRDPRPVLRLYRWRPHAVSLGHFQEPDQALLDFCARRPCDLVRRPSGGGALYHGAELTYALVLPDQGWDDRRALYRAVHQAIAEGLATLGLATALRESPEEALRQSLCNLRRVDFDLMAAGQKLVGSAQRRKHGRILQHGVLPLAPDPLAEGGTNISRLRGRATPTRLLVPALLRGLGSWAAARFRRGGLCVEEQRLAVRLCAAGRETRWLRWRHRFDPQRG